MPMVRKSPFQIIIPGTLGWDNLLQQIQNNDSTLSPTFELDVLEFNKIGDAGAQALAAVLKDNYTLTSLKLRYTRIGNAGAQALATMLKNNHFLTSLSLCDNEIGDAGAQALAAVLKDNYTLTSLDLRCNQIDEALKAEIKHLLEQNGQRCDALHAAVKSNQLDQMELLIKQGVSLLSVTGEGKDAGNTPLHWAAYCGHAEIVKRLIALMNTKCISLNIPNKKGKTALQLAQARGHQATIALLQSPRQNDVSLTPKPLVSLSAPTEPAQNTPMARLSSTLLSSTINHTSATTSNSNLDAPAKSLSHLPFSFQIAYSELDIDKNNELGRGGFGIVYGGTYRYSDVAIKELHAAKLSVESEKEFHREAEVMANLHSQHIVRLYGICIEQQPYLMVMEYMPKGSLYNVLHSNMVLDWNLRQQIGLEISYGLGFLHKVDILHRDLKSSNILLDANYHAKLSDFGLAKVKTETVSTATKGHVKGTLAWTAPELFNPDAKYTSKSDIYSYGMVLWELSSRKIPFQNASNASLIPVWIAQGHREKIPSDCPPKISHLIQWCWKAQPEERPTVDQAIQQLKEDQPKSTTTSAPAQTSVPTSGPLYLSNTQTTNQASAPTSVPMYRDALQSPGYRR